MKKSEEMGGKYTNGKAVIGSVGLDRKKKGQKP